MQRPHKARDPLALQATTGSQMNTNPLASEIHYPTTVGALLRASRRGGAGSLQTTNKSRSI
jgi:hypothetical protein